MLSALMVRLAVVGAAEIKNTEIQNDKRINTINNDGSKLSYQTFIDMNISPQGIKLIQHYESCRLKAYQDSKGITTIGWGNTTYLDGRAVKMGDIITQQQADELFAKSLLKYEQMVLTRIKRELLQQEFDAAVSFCYNAGTSYKTPGGTWKDYDLWKHINNRYFDIANYWQSCAVTAGGKKLKGLVNRRKSEVHLYLAGEVVFYN